MREAKVEGNLLDEVARLRAKVEELERTEGARAERYLTAQYAVTRLLAEAPDLDTATPRVVQALGQTLGWEVGAIWRRDDEAGVLRCVQVWHEPWVNAPEFLDVTRRFTFAPGVGLPGRVWASEEPVWSSDIAQESNFPRAPWALKEGLHGSFAFPIKLGDSVLGVIEFFSSQVRPPDNYLLQMVAAIGSQVGQFIERKRVEEELSKSRDQLEAIIEGVAEGITVTNSQGRLVYANQEAVRTLGYPSEQALLEAPLQELFGKFEIRDEEGNSFPMERLPGRQVHAGADHASALVHFRVKATGEERWSLVRATPVRDEQGRILYAINIFQDVTERRKAEEATRLLAEAGDVLTSSLDYETTLAQVARLALPQFADWGYVDMLDDDGTIRRLAAAHSDPAKEGLVRELLRFPPLPESRHVVARALKSGKPNILEFIDDSYLLGTVRNEEHLNIVRALEPRSLMVLPLTARGRTLGAITFVYSSSGRHYEPSDLAQGKELARRAALAVDNARLYREARNAVKARDEFLSVAAHELKTPLTNLKGYAQLVLRGLEKSGELDPMRVRTALRAIDQQSDKLAHLVSQLLDVSRIEAGRLVLQREVANVAEIVEGVVTAARTAAGRHTISLDAPEEVRALVDSLRLEQVVANLVNNAVKFSPDGGPIDVRVYLPEPGRVAISVKDRGTGVQPEDRPMIFERFFQGRVPNSSAGMGLGLFISRQIIDLHGGRVEADFPPEGGASFTVTIPTGINGSRSRNLSRNRKRE